MRKSCPRQERPSPKIAQKTNQTGSSQISTNLKRQQTHSLPDMYNSNGILEIMSQTQANTSVSNTIAAKDGSLPRGPSPTTTTTTAFSRGKVELPVDFVPSDNDVLCGKGKECFNHPGNRRFRALVNLNLRKYAEAKSKLAKSSIVNDIVDSVRLNASNGGGFIRQNNKTKVWYEIGDVLAREKVGHTIRETLVLHNPAKNEVRKQKRAINKRRRLAGQGSQSSCSQERKKNSLQVQSQTAIPEFVFAFDTPDIALSTDATPAPSQDWTKPPELVATSSTEWFSTEEMKALVNQDLFEDETSSFEDFFEDGQKRGKQHGQFPYRSLALLEC